MNQPSQALSIQELCVSYGANVAIQDVSFTVPTGAVMGLIGPNGAGKSTIIKSAIDLIPRQSGTVFFFGQPLNQTRNRVAYMPQAVAVDWDYPITVAQVVSMGLFPKKGWFRRISKQDRDFVYSCLDRVGIAELAKRQISELSGGQRRRVFMARILVQQPDLYLLDEPFAGVDAASERVIRGVLHELRDGGATVVIVHHDLSTVTELCDCVSVINQHVIATGPIAEAFTKQTINDAFGLGLL